MLSTLTRSICSFALLIDFSLTEGSGNASSAAAGVGAENEEEVEEQEGDGRSKENQSPKKQRESRLLKLGEFQLKMIQHAMKCEFFGGSDKFLSS